MFLNKEKKCVIIFIIEILFMKMNLFDLTGKVVVITGGASGLGLAYARGIAKHGGNLSIWDVSESKIESAKNELKEYGINVTTQVVDVKSEEQIIAAYEQVLKDHGRLDCVFANAGVPPNSRSIFDMTSQNYLDLINVNMHGAFYTLKEGARLMVERAKAGEPGGSLVFTGSLALFKGIPGIENYAAAKGAIAAVIRGLAVELAQFGIRANTIAPGYIKTGMTNGQQEMSAIDASMIANIPMGRAGYPEDFEAIAVYFCSDASSFHTGDTVILDGADHIKG
ncbi:SDR family NAD(P)-dependent oxidoreductase [Myroides odoratimimus]|uniref:SDR family NAD(P)-dependent oxidoreductase n=2 Tax=Myroides odoratimimus TaxID=76832 RepID=UPI001C4992D2|nr:SDR family oxidoreductase [Myroides odoratimimus]